MPMPLVSGKRILPYSLGKFSLKEPRNFLASEPASNSMPA